MTSPASLRWLYALIAAFILLIGVRFGTSFSQAAADGNSQCMLVYGLIGGGLLGYTLIRAAWRIAAQVYLSRVWRSSFRSNRDVKLSKRLAYRYRSIGAEIMVVKDASFLALTIGIRRPVIVVSSAVLDMFREDEVKAILLHEWHHCLRRDNARLFLAKLMTDAFGYLPIMRPLYHCCRTWTELLADRFAIRRMGTELPLARVLLKLSKMGGVRLHTAAVHFAATMDCRIAQALDPDRTVKVHAALFRPMLLTIMLVFLMLIGGDS